MAEKYLKKKSVVASSDFFRNLRNIANKHWWVQALIVALIMFLGVSLRAFQVDRYPIDNLDDGIYYVWAGVSFWHNPLAVTSLTLFDANNDRLFWRSQYLDEIPHQEFGFRLVQPWFDHPPLGVALIGLPAYLLGYDAFENIPYSIVRLPAVLASVFTLVFSFLFFKQLFGTKQSIVATFILATTPYFVFAHRQSYLENMLTPFFLLAVWQGYLVISKQSTNKLNWIFAVVAAFACGWIKLVGLIVPIILASWSYRKGNWQAVMIFAGTALTSLASYIVYGMASGATGFWQTLFTQSGRGMFWGNAAEIIVNQGLAGTFKDTTLLLGWIAVFLFLFITTQKKAEEKNNSEEFFAWVFISWLMVIVLSSGQFNNFIWYRYPLFPLLSYGLAWFLIQLWHKPNLIGALLLLLLGWSQLFVAFPGLLAEAGARNIVITGLSVPFLLYLFGHSQRINVVAIHRAWLLILCLLIFVTNLLVVLKFPEYYCAHAENCKLPAKIMVAK